MLVSTYYYDVIYLVGSGPNQRSLMSSTFEFTEKMSKILFLDLKEPIIISESREIFVKAMEEFVELEREVCTYE